MPAATASQTPVMASSAAPDPGSDSSHAGRPATATTPMTRATAMLQSTPLTALASRPVALTAEEVKGLAEKNLLRGALAEDFHGRFFNDGGTRVFPVEVRYTWPSELDLMARLAGLRLRERWGDWRRGAFDAKSEKHVSVYERPA